MPGRVLRLSLIGPLPPPFSGTTVSFRGLVRDLQQVPSLEVQVTNTEADRSKPLPVRLWRSLVVLLGLIGRLKRSDVVLLNGSNRRAMVLGATMALAAAVVKRPVVVRVFGGGLFEEFRKWGAFERWCTKVVFRRCLVLLQTRALMESFQRTFPHARLRQLPTNRPLAPAPSRTPARTDGPGLRCVLASDAAVSKGFDVVLEAFRGMPPGITLDVFGALRLSGSGLPGPEGWPAGLRYRGVVDATELQAKLGEFDLLLLPTRWPNEGYPGVVIEAMMAALPVLATAVGGLPELVEPGTGVLLPDLDPARWREAILGLARDPARRAELSAGARRRAADFDSAYWQREFLPRLLAEAAGRQDLS